MSLQIKHDYAVPRRIMCALARRSFTTRACACACACAPMLTIVCARRNSKLINYFAECARVNISRCDVARRTDEREIARSPYFFLLSPRASRICAGLFFFISFFFLRHSTAHGTRARMSQGGRNVPFGCFYLLLSEHVESINSSEEKRALVSPAVLPPAYALATGGTNCAQKSICIRDPCANK